MLEPLNRVLSESAHNDEHSYRTRRKMITSDSTSEADSPTKEVIQLLENVCGTELFISALTSVKAKARDKRVTRK